MGLGYGDEVRLRMRMRSNGPSLCFTRLFFQVAIRALGFEVKKADVLKILKDYDKEGKGKVTFQDFNEISESIINFVDYKYYTVTNCMLKIGK